MSNTRSIAGCTLLRRRGDVRLSAVVASPLVEEIELDYDEACRNSLTSLTDEFISVVKNGGTFDPPGL